MTRTTTEHPAAAFADTKPHYDILDGLRGVAALLVIWYHVFEGFATSPLDQRFNHGYLAVDFFFLLSGFVIGYAYDDRWRGRMTLGAFFRRRLIRLHPMVVLAAVLGAVAFCLQGSVRWDGTPVAFPTVLAAMLLAMLLLPVAPGAGAEVRGNGEMFPLNGPSWSLFFEYIGNILYALVLRRLSTRALAALVALTGTGLAAFAVGDLSGFGHLGVGWSLGDHNLLGGLLRLAFSFPAGLLLARIFRPVAVRAARRRCGSTASTTPCASWSASPRCCGSGLRAARPTGPRRASAGFWATSPIRSTSSTIPPCTFSMRGCGAASRSASTGRGLSLRG